VRGLSRSHPLLAPLLAAVSWRGGFSRPRFALTFNGVPASASATAELLALLAHHGARATFFVTGEMATRQPLDVKAVARAGHEVGVLGLSGPTRTEEVLADIAATKARLASAGVAPLWFRPQDGSRDVRVLRGANREGLAVALWSVCPYDWAGLPSELQARAVAQAGTRGGGDVVVLHAVLPDYLQPPSAAHAPPHNVVEATRAVLAGLAAAHRQSAVTMSELCPHQGRANEPF
jgi:peptidoglycan/xylan/chitin deacetylase (PgdA/CDA1 family)